MCHSAFFLKMSTVYKTVKWNQNRVAFSIGGLFNEHLGKDAVGLSL